MYFEERDYQVTIEATHFNAGAPSFSGQFDRIRYGVLRTMNDDFKDIYEDVVYMVNEANGIDDGPIGTPPQYLPHFDYMDNILYNNIGQERGLNGFTHPTIGTYPLKISYTLPGTTQITTNHTLQLKLEGNKY